MFQQQVFILNMILMTLDSLCIIGGGYAAHFLRSYQSYWLWSMDDYAFSLSILFVMFANNVVMAKAGLYSDGRIHSYWKLCYDITCSVFFDFLALSALVFVFHHLAYSRIFLLYFAVFSLILILITRLSVTYYVNNIAAGSFNTRRLLVIGDTIRGQYVLDALNRQLSLGHRIVSYLTTEGHNEECAERLAQLPQILTEQEIDEVIFAVPKDRTIDLSPHLALCSRMGISVRILPALWYPDRSPLRVDQCQGIPFLTLNFNNFNATGQLYKRILDLAGAAVGILIMCLLYPFIAIAIKLDTKGPVFFRQDRIGKNGRVFKLYKFRSMYMDAEERKKDLMYANEMKGPMFKLAKDPRVTRVGRVIRKLSLDELPQFINVLKGEMSMVGTRPPTTSEVKQYELSHFKRISFKPGITGLWQISGRNEISDFAEIVRLDCQYLDNWRFRDDLIILARTIVVVLARKGAW
ncbi:MAG: sugar transferase [Desulfobacteraceae bacterium]|nr:sugar transferase [Desulfobacteraceae bacterium]